MVGFSSFTLCSGTPPQPGRCPSHIPMVLCASGTQAFKAEVTLVTAPQSVLCCGHRSYPKYGAPFGEHRPWALCTACIGSQSRKINRLSRTSRHVKGSLGHPAGADVPRTGRLSHAEPGFCREDDVRVQSLGGMPYYPGESRCCFQNALHGLGTGRQQLWFPS